MSNLIPFDFNNIPAHIRKVDASKLNSDLLAHAGGGFPVISIKGKIFAVKRDGVRTVLPNPKDPEAAATAIEVVLLKVNKNTSKVYYTTGWKEGDDSKPVCFSNDGKTPDASVEKPQSRTCATCKHNQWGSKISDNGTKLKSCTDSIRMAVAAPDQLNDPMLLRVPPASMRAVGEYGSILAKRGVAYNTVVTRVGFDPEASTPKLTLKPVGFMSDADVEEARQVAESDLVDNIINGGPAGAVDSEQLEAPTMAEKVIDKAAAKSADKFTDDDVEQSIAKAVAPAQDDEEEEAPPPKKAKAAAKPKAAEIDVDLDLGDLDFDD